MTTTEKPGIAERYAAASGSSNLRCEGDRAGDTDVLIAAAWSCESDGGALSRCRNEFDDAHASIPQNIGATNRRMLTMMRVNSLPSAKAIVRSFAIERIEKRAQKMAEKELHDLSWQALSVFLDPSCPMCTGRTFSGGYDGPQIRCRHCHETGKRRGFVGNSDAQREFVEALICRIESAVSEFQTKTTRRLRTSE